MRKMVSHGTADDMLDAFQSKLNMLENATNKDVESSTSVNAANKRTKYAHGTADQMLSAFEKKVAELKGDVSASSTVEAAYKTVESDPTNVDRYIHTLIGDTNAELEDLDIFDSWTWEYDDTDLVLTTVKDSAVEEYTVPRADLKFDWDMMEEDVQYIVRAITNPGEDEFAEDVTSATVIEASEDDKSVVIPNYAKTELYADSQGAFGGNENDIYSLEDLMIIWNSDHNSDPSMQTYDSFEEWWADTEAMLEPVNDQSVMSATAVDASSDLYALVATDGEPLLVFEADDLDDANAQVADYNNLYRTDYSAEYEDAVDVESAEFVGRLSDLEDRVGSSFTEIASKQVQDSDGFMTDYTMYRDTETGEYVFVFGDKDIYTPEQGDFDWSCDEGEEAWDWFYDYTGFSEEDEGNDEYEDDEHYDEEI